MNIGSLISVLFTSENVHGPGHLNCSTWILSTQLIISIVGLLLLSVAVKTYHRRKKEDHYNYYAVVERHYDQFLINKQNKAAHLVTSYM